MPDTKHDATDDTGGQTNGSYPHFSRTYPEGFIVDPAYRAALPDIQNSSELDVRGADRQIQHVGISHFRLPLKFRNRGGEVSTLEVSVSGTVSLEARKKGINMSRIMRSFYDFSDRVFDFAELTEILSQYRKDHETPDARLQLRFSYPMLKPSLRSGLAGYQFYDVAMELSGHGGVERHILHLDYVYSSTCPCSLELSEHARLTRAQLATPHSQRSVARMSIELRDPSLVIEDVVDLCVAAVPTETQTMVKREDEQAFAELNAANPIFVEDAVRLFSQELSADHRIGDFRVVASHQESLHSHDAVSILTEGELFAADRVDTHLFGSLIHSH